MKTLTAALSLAIALTLAGPAAAAQIFTVTSPSGVVHGATEAELTFWTTVGERGGAPDGLARAARPATRLDGDAPQAGA